LKTKKILAIMTLVAFMVSILPMAAFADPVPVPYNTYGSVVSVEEDSAKAVAISTDTDKDGLEFEITLVSPTPQVGGTLYALTNRGTDTDKIYYKDNNGDWQALDSEGVDVSDLSTATDKIVVVDVKILSNIAGNVKVAFGNDFGAVENYVNGREFGPGESIGNIIGQKLYEGTFTAAGVGTVTLTKKTGSSVAANGVSYHEVEAYVESAAGYPVSGIDVEFSISGTGASLSASKVKTGTNGKAKVKITATKPGTYELTAKADKKESNKLALAFGSTGVVNIKAESDNNQKIAIDSGIKKFKYTLYDAAGNRIAPTDEDISDIEVEVVKEPAKSDLDLDNGDLSEDDGKLVLEIDTADLKEGDYEVRVYLLNGKQVTYAFSAKEQGDIVKMDLKYDSDSYAAESVVPSPTIKYTDADGYTTEVTSGFSNIKFSVSDATFIKQWEDDGSFELAKDKTGSFVVTAIDTDEDLVATFTITVGKAASYLKLTAPSYTAVGEEAKVTIQLVDADGKPVAPGVLATDSDAFVISKPEGAIVGDLDVDVDDFDEGKASVDVTCNVPGNVAIQVIITDENGKSYAGTVTVPFGEVAAAKKSLVMFIGSTNYMVGNTPAVTDVAPFIENGRTYVAVRPIGEALGMTIYWDATTQTVTMTKPGETVTIVIGANSFKVDRAGSVTEYPTDAPAKIKDGRTFLPFRAIGEAMGYTVNYDAATQAVTFM